MDAKFKSNILSLIITLMILSWVTETSPTDSEFGKTFWNSSSFNHLGKLTHNNFQPPPENEQKFFFSKCCPPNKILSEGGCLPKEDNYVSSARMTELMKNFAPRSKWPTYRNNNNCSLQIRSKERQIHWELGTGNIPSTTKVLFVTSTNGNTMERNYCLEDYREVSGAIESMAILCLREVAHILPDEILDHYVGKCCEKEEYADKSRNSIHCVRSSNNFDKIMNEDFLVRNATGTDYIGLPKCKYGNSYRPFFYSNEKSCLLHNVRKSKYCVDYAINQKSPKTKIFICASNIVGNYRDKNSLPVLMGISCFSLLATVPFVAATKVKQGSYIVRKINTLTGRILFSYVMSWLLSYAFMAIQFIRVIDLEIFSEGTCFILGAFLLFFSLSALLWNTSICVESLVLTMKAQVSENHRYLCYCLLSWGFPGIISAVAMILDQYRTSLPCSVITPNFGAWSCFFSDPTAELLYLYVPSFITLCVNLLVLVVNKLVRHTKARKLEQDATSYNTFDTQGGCFSDESTRKYEQQYEWKTSLKLVLWTALTWIFEAMPFLYDYFVGVFKQWQEDLMHIAFALSALRGVGIFYIIVLTEERRTSITNQLQEHCPWVIPLKNACSRLKDYLKASFERFWVVQLLGSRNP